MHLEVLFFHQLIEYAYVSILVSNWMHLEDGKVRFEMNKGVCFNPSF